MRTAGSLFLVALALCGCASVSSSPQPVAAHQTLATDRRLMADDVEDFCEPELWNRLKTQPYRAFVVMDALIDHNDRVQITGVRERYADATCEARARALAAEIKVRATTAGSNLPVHGTVLVVFFASKNNETKIDTLVFAEQTTVPGRGTPRGGRSLRVYLAKR